MLILSILFQCNLFCKCFTTIFKLVYDLTPAVNLTIILPTRTFNYAILRNLAVRDNPFNKIITNMTEIKEIICKGNKPLDFT